MARDSYRDATTVSTRTFQTPSSKSAKDATSKEAKAARGTPKLPRLSVAAQRLPWFIVVVLIVISLFLFTQYHDAKNKLTASQAGANNQQVSAIIKKVDKLAVLPINETPTVATVSNVSKLKSQSFFANAANGDKVIVYDKAKIAVLYRPSTNQIVNIAPVSSSAGNATQ